MNTSLSLKTCYSGATHICKQSWTKQSRFPLLIHTKDANYTSHPLLQRWLSLKSSLWHNTSACSQSLPHYTEEKLWIKASNRARSNAKWWVRDKHKTNRCAFAFCISDGEFAPWAWARAFQAHTEADSEIHSLSNDKINTNQLVAQFSVWFLKISVYFSTVCGRRFMSPWHIPVVAPASSQLSCFPAVDVKAAEMLLSSADIDSL